MKNGWIFPVRYVASSYRKDIADSPRNVHRHTAEDRWKGDNLHRTILSWAYDEVGKPVL